MFTKHRIMWLVVIFPLFLVAAFWPQVTSNSGGILTHTVSAQEGALLVGAGPCYLEGTELCPEVQGQNTCNAQGCDQVEIQPGFILTICNRTSGEFPVHLDYTKAEGGHAPPTGSSGTMNVGNMYCNWMCPCELACVFFDLTEVWECNEQFSLCEGIDFQNETAPNPNFEPCNLLIADAMSPYFRMLATNGALPYSSP